MTNKMQVEVVSETFGKAKGSRVSIKGLVVGFSVLFLYSYNTDMTPGASEFILD
jgi:hypothetical protein